MTAPRPGSFDPDVARATAAEVAFPNPSSGGSSYRKGGSGKRPRAPRVRVRRIHPPITADEVRLIIGKRPVKGRWQDSALCRDADPSLFFPTPGTDQRRVKAICAACKAQANCLLHALNNGEHWGVWGGMSERERRTVRRRQWESKP